jgi:hypothetical protein
MRRKPYRAPMAEPHVAKVPGALGSSSSTELLVSLAEHLCGMLVC